VFGVHARRVRRRRLGLRVREPVRRGRRPGTDLLRGAPADRPHRCPPPDRLHRPHPSPPPRPPPGPPGAARRGGRAGAPPPFPGHHEPGLCPPRRCRHPGGAVPGRGVAEEGGGPVNYPVPAAQGRSRLRVVAGEAAALDGEWAADRWKATRLGIPARRGRGQARFDQISQPWLREAGKRWSRFRLAPGRAFPPLSGGALALTRFSRFLATCPPEVGQPAEITRPVLEDYLSWLLTEGYSAATRALSLSMIRVFFEACHRHGWLPG